MVKSFSFNKTSLPKLPSPFSQRIVKKVNPNIEHLAGWVSAVGASVAINDLDRDGQANDICYVNNRTDQVIIAPAPETGARYQPFALDLNEIPGFNAEAMPPTGCLPGDFNEDGNMDILVYFWGRSPVIFLHVPEANASQPYKLAQDQYFCRDLVSPAQDWYTGAATSADLDGDGHYDLIIGNYFPDGDELFNTKSKVIPVMQHSMSRATNGGGPHFFLWQPTALKEGGAIFAEASEAVPAATKHSWVLAVGTADLDGDLLPEIYIANDYGNDMLLHNESKPGALSFSLLKGERHFMTPSSKVLGHDSYKGMGMEFADLNGDGYFDMFISNIAGEFALEESHFAFISTGKPELIKQGIAPYEDQSEPLGVSRSGWGWDIKLADFNNAGQLELVQATGFLRGAAKRWPELHELGMGNDQLSEHPQVWLRLRVKDNYAGDDLSGHDHNPFYVMAKDGRFYDLAKEIGIGEENVTRGIAVADVDGDGLLEFAIANQWSDSTFYKNNSPKKGHFIGFNIQIPIDPNARQETTVNASTAQNIKARPALGTLVTLTLADGRKMIGQVDGGNGHSGKRSQQVHFGLGNVDASQPVKAKLQWRDASGPHEYQIPSLTVDKWYTVNLGKS